MGWVTDILARAGNCERDKPLQQNMRDNWEAFVAMRDSINELTGNMISIEAALLEGPEQGLQCQAIVEAVAQSLATERARSIALAHDLTIADETIRNLETKLKTYENALEEAIERRRKRKLK